MHDAAARFLADLATDQASFALIAPLNPNSRTPIGETPLHIATVRGDTSAMAALLDAGAKIDTPGEHGYTALHEAAAQRHAATVTLLLSRGASTNIANDDGCTPQQLAELLEHHDITPLFHGQPTA
jgi:ankyrin repeat protein